MARSSWLQADCSPASYRAGPLSLLGNLGSSSRWRVALLLAGVANFQATPVTPEQDRMSLRWRNAIRPLLFDTKWKSGAKPPLCSTP